MITDLAFGFSLCAYFLKSKKPVQNNLIIVRLSKRVDYDLNVYYKAYWFHFKNECTLNCKYDTLIELFNERRKVGLSSWFKIFCYIPTSKEFCRKSNPFSPKLRNINVYLDCEEHMCHGRIRRWKEQKNNNYPSLKICPA